MKLSSLKFCLAIAACLLGSVAIARNPVNAPPRQHHQGYKEEAAGCNIPADQFDMDVNNVRARVLDAGDLWWDLANGHYEVPKGDKSSTTPLPQAIFAGAIWISALDQGNNLRIAALEYRAGTSDYYTGPLDANGNVSLSQCNIWDGHFPVWATQIKPLVAAYAAPGSNGQVADAFIADSVRYWPGKGNPYLAAKGYDVSGVLAPFYDANGDGIYDPKFGDYPTIKQSGLRTYGKGCDSLTSFAGCNNYADEMVFWVMNDKGNTHTATNGSPMGIQVNEVAFAFQSSDEVNNMTFYTYNIINKSGNVLNKTYMSQWTDVDLGCANNDRVGCDTSRSLAICYNGFVAAGNNVNGVTCDVGSAVCPSSEVGYGCNLPMLGIEYFEGPTDTTTTLNPTTHVRTPIHLGMSSFCYFNNGGTPAKSDPTTPQQFRNYQTGLWLDGTPFTYGGDGYTGGSVRTSYCFPGDPSVANQWSECNPQVGTAPAASDRRMVQTSGPFTFMPCASEIITIGVIFVQPAGGVGSNCPSFSFITPAADKAKALFNACFQASTGPSAPILNLRAMDQKVIINITDDPAGNNVGENFAQPDLLRVSKGWHYGEDSLYKFQGYVIYQLAGPTVSVSDLSDPTKAVPVAVFDIKDNITHLVNWSRYSDNATSTSVWEHNAQALPGVGNDFPNLGIKHAFVDSLDAIGGGAMVNHKTYYFGAISFATNNFKQFVPDSSLGQYQPVLSGTLNTFDVIPENSSSTAGGRLLNSAFGSSSQVKRLEGQGDGGNYIDIDGPTILKILNSQFQFTDTLDYVVGQDPLAFKVVDPILIKQADFELIIRDTVPYNGVSVSSQAWWELNDLTNNITIHSVSTLNRPYEQIIEDASSNQYGFSITLGTPFPVYTNQIDNQPVYGPIGGSITFADPSKPWLSFLRDSGSTIANNWIRSGSYALTCNVASGITPDPLCNVFVDAYYTYHPTPTTTVTALTDPNGLFGNIAGGEWAPYCLTSNWSMAPGVNPPTGRPITVGGPAFKWNRYDDKALYPQNNLDQIQGVDIILTSDKTKWSQCIVFETGEVPILDNSALPDGSGIPPRKGLLRNHNGIDQNGVENPDPTQVGLSYFPGYAVNVETGQRLDIAFGEASDEADQNGRDMIWNPTSQVFGTLNQGGDVPYSPIFGGRHFIYVLNTLYGTAISNIQPIMTTQTLPNGHLLYTDIVNTNINSAYPALDAQTLNTIYSSIMWTAIPYLTPGYSMLSLADGLIPNDVNIKLRVEKPYNKFATNATNSADSSVFARYSFSTFGLAAKTNDDSVAKTALDMIRIVPNPYLAYSAYETSANDAEVKVTNLPNNCTIKIYTLDGILVRTLSRALTTDPVTNKAYEITNGYALNTPDVAIDNSVNWDMKNQAAIPVSSGIYLFDIDVPGVGHKVLKWFGAMRPTDVSNF